MGNQKALAIGWDKCQQYVSAILKGDKRDPFAAFRSMYEGACRGHVETAPWDRELELLREKHRRPESIPDAAEAFREKFTRSNAVVLRYVAAIEDGRIDETEARDLLALIEIEEPMLASLKKSLVAHLATLT